MNDEHTGTPRRSKPPGFTFYVKDWLASERVALMSGCAEGLYIRLLSLCWDNESLPADEGALMALAPKHRRCWGRCWPQVAPCFEKRGDRLHHLKLDSQRIRLQELSETRAETGRKGGLARSNSQANAKQPPSLAVAVAVANQKPSATRGPKRDPWIKPYAEAWEARFQGIAPWGRIGHAFKPLRGQHSDAEILERWTRYLAQGKPGVANPDSFAQTYGAWGPAPSATDSRITKDTAIRRAFNAGLRGVDDSRIPRNGFETEQKYQHWLTEQLERSRESA